MVAAGRQAGFRLCTLSDNVLNILQVCWLTLSRVLKPSTCQAIPESASPLPRLADTLVVNMVHLIALDVLSIGSTGTWRTLPATPRGAQ